jgi:hypothetical protein
MSFTVCIYQIFLIGLVLIFTIVLFGLILHSAHPYLFPILSKSARCVFLYLYLYLLFLR